MLEKCLFVLIPKKKTISLLRFGRFFCLVFSLFRNQKKQKTSENGWLFCLTLKFVSKKHQTKPEIWKYNYYIWSKCLRSSMPSSSSSKNFCLTIFSLDHLYAALCRCVVNIIISFRFSSSRHLQKVISNLPNNDVVGLVAFCHRSLLSYSLMIL